MLKTIRTAALAAAAATALATGASAQTIQVDPGKLNTLRPGPQIQLPPDRLRLACPDPAAAELRLTNIRVRSEGSARHYDFDVVGTIRNLGAAAWSSGRGQQVAGLKRGAATVASRDFVSLAPGASFTLTTRMSLYSADEFPPGVELSIGYDPDIRLDGNPANDDCRSGNNLRRLSGHELLRLASGR